MDVEAVRNWVFPVIRQHYSIKDSILYALSLGYGSDPLSESELSFVFEKNLQAVPTLSTTLCSPGFWISDPRTGIDATRAVHGEHAMRMHAPLPAAGRLRGETRVTDIIDKGKDKGALLIFERDLFDDESGQLIASVKQSTLCRGDGGFTLPDAARHEGVQPAPPSWSPVAAASVVVDIPTLPQSALIYRLCADMNPLHADPQMARAAGFERPILHGMCTYGIAARAIIAACCNNRAASLRALSVRFTSPVFPGETLRTEIWRDAAELRFRCSVVERGVTVISNGIATVATDLPADLSVNSP